MSRVEELVLPPVFLITKGENTMKNMATVVGDVAQSLIALFKGLVVASVFAAILFAVPWNGLDGTMALVSKFLNGGLTGLLTLLLLASWMK
jgi:hypothetical protein|tara:strand:- start:2009 stop:2281 length:273 start_codon:yes stop_codon:yes gene_type:complete